MTVNVLPEDKIQLTQEQKNLIELAFINQVRPEDTKILEKMQKSKNADPFMTLSNHFTSKYGFEFGTLYFAAILGGEKRYKETLDKIERLRAEERMRSEKS